MWTLKRKFEFEAAHRLPGHEGKCKRMHGHSWVGYLVAEGSRLQQEGPAIGMLCDFSTIKEAMAPLLEHSLDHFILNDLFDHPTSELLAKWIYDRVKPALPQLVAVILEETRGSSCEYRP